MEESSGNSKMDLLKKVAERVRTVRSEIKGVGAVEAGQVMVIINEDCPSCEEMIEMLGSEVESGGIMVIQNDTPLGRDIEANVDIRGYPECIVKMEDGSLVRCDDAITEAEGAPNEEPAD